MLRRFSGYGQAGFGYLKRSEIEVRLSRSSYDTITSGSRILTRRRQTRGVDKKESRCRRRGSGRGGTKVRDETNRLLVVLFIFRINCLLLLLLLLKELPASSLSSSSLTVSRGRAQISSYSISGHVTRSE